MPIPQVIAVEDIASAYARFDSIVFVAPSLDAVKSYPWGQSVLDAKKVDSSIGEDVSLVIISKEYAGGRLVFSPTGPLDREIDDVRRYGDAARAGAMRAVSAGSVRPLLIVVEGEMRSTLASTRGLEVSLLSILAGLYQPLQAREKVGEKSIETVEEVGFVVPSGKDGTSTARIVSAIESGRRLAKDVGGSDCERMTPKRVASYVEASFQGSCVKVSVEHNLEVIEKSYPLLHAVTRASLPVERHHPCVIRLEYQPEGPVSQTLLLAGKGVTYDTGGADLKVGGAMGGMSMDKCGAAAVAGLLKVASILQPKGVRIIGLMGMVRNSIGSNAYVSDEIIRGRSGVHVRIGNTDAEGRMVLADLLCELREYAEQREDIRGTKVNLMSIATLTGHAVLAMGPYSVVVSNGPAKKEGLPQSLQQVSEIWGDPFEVSNLRREDYNFIKPKNKAYDVIQANDLPSSRTQRGHQFPAAFLDIASGLSKHAYDSSQPLNFSHLDIAATAAEDMDDLHGKATGVPIVTLTAKFLLQ